jgi:hypothetical protein
MDLRQKVMMAARLIKRIDSDELRVYVDRTKNQIKKAPEYKPSPLNRSAGTS